MPKSKGRQKKQAPRYRVAPQRKRRRKASPRWYGAVVLALMGVGVVIIVINYIGLIPGTGDQASNAWLWIGLGLIGAGFIGTTFWY